MVAAKHPESTMPTTLEEAQLEVQRARQHEENIRRRINEGDRIVTPGDLAAAAAAREFAVMRLEALKVEAIVISDAPRIEEIDKIVRELSRGSLAAKARQLADVIDRARAALTDAFVLAERYRADKTRLLEQLAALGAMPPELNVTSTGTDVFAYHTDGRSWTSAQVPSSSLVGAIALEAVEKAAGKEWADPATEYIRSAAGRAQPATTFLADAMRSAHH